MYNTEILLSIKLSRQLFVDPKRIRLLREIQQCGSINQAAKLAGVSYKSAWDHLEMMNAISPKPLLERSTGGKNGGGTSLTVYAQRLLQLYDLLAQTQEKAFHILQDENVSLDSLLSATAKFALQSSARNQFFGRVKALRQQALCCHVEIDIPDFSLPLVASITTQSAVRLQLTLGKEVMVMIKAPWVKLGDENDSSQNRFIAKVKSIVDEEHHQEVVLALGDSTECCAVVEKNNNIVIGQQIGFHIDPEQVILLTL